MSACAMLSYNGVTRAAWQTIKVAAAPYGVKEKIQVARRSMVSL
jgi:hypothetical protein